MTYCSRHHDRYADEGKPAEWGEQK